MEAALLSSENYTRELGFDYAFDWMAKMIMKNFLDWRCCFVVHAWTKSFTSTRKFFWWWKSELYSQFKCCRSSFLSYNATEELQLVDNEVTGSVKARYHKLQYGCVLDDLETHAYGIYSINQLTEMKHIDAIWPQLPVQMVLNWWTSSGVNTSENFDAL